MIENIVKQEYNLHLKEVKRLGKSFFQKNFSITDEQGNNYFVKKLPVNSEIENIQFEVSLMCHLTENSIKVPKVYLTTTGMPFFNFDGNNYVLLEFKEGTHDFEIAPTIMEQVGKELALLHKALKSFNISNKDLKSSYLSIFETEIVVQKLKDFYLQLVDQKEKSDFEKLFVEEYSNLLEIVNQFEKSGFESTTYIHGDLHSKNIVFKGERFESFIDFSNATYSIVYEDIVNIVYDLSQKHFGEILNKSLYHSVMQSYLQHNQEVLILDDINLALIFKMSKIRDLVTISSHWRIAKKILNNQLYCFNLLSNITNL